MEPSLNKKENYHRFFLTLFDSNYLAKALVAYQSLVKHHHNFTLYAFCFDDTAFSVIKKINCRHLIPIHYKDFESPELIKTKMSKQKYYEYYWSFNAYLVLWVMEKTKAEIVTYLDCDFMFFSSPERIFQEMEGADILIQPNNFSYEEEGQFIPVGYYCACYGSFRNNAYSRRILKQWYRQCLNWCSATFEQGKFGDQKYLDNWRVKFTKVREISAVGANIAPWNIQKYDITPKKEKIFINNVNPLIYYHYHSFKMNLSNLGYIITGDRGNSYRIPKLVIEYIYTPYIQAMKKVIKQLKCIPEFREYARRNPESNVHLIRPSIIQFDSYKKHINNKN